MKVIHVSSSDIQGGAAISAYRLHRALRTAGLASTMVTDVAKSGDWTVQRPRSKVSRALVPLRPHLGNVPRYWFTSDNVNLHSTAMLPSTWVKHLNWSGGDLLHLHWINNEMLSIADIGQLRRPLVWTLHDMWAFCGAEHYTEDSRWQTGYWRDNRPADERGFDLNRWTWQRKRRHWQRPIQIVTPSHWLANCVAKSALMANWPITVIPTPIDTEVWQPCDRTWARQLLGLPLGVPLVLFGSAEGNHERRKGFDLLQSALADLKETMPTLELVVLGQPAPEKPADLGFSTHYMGYLHDAVSLRLLYSAVDVVIVPSRQDNLPNIGLEAQACGTPVVAFDACGLPDVVEHQRTGYLAQAFEPADLAQGIEWVLGDRDRLVTLRQAARQRAIEQWSPHVVAKNYLEVYQTVLAAHQATSYGDKG